MTTPDEPAASYRAVPAVNERDEPFWTGGAEGHLMMQRCRDCGHVVHPPALLCHWDRSSRLEWEPVSGRGRVETFTENRQPFLPGYPVPSVIALVQLDDDPTARVLTDLVGVTVDRVEIGMAVQVQFEHLHTDDGPDVYLPVFVPVADAGAEPGGGRDE